MSINTGQDRPASMQSLPLSFITPIHLGTSAWLLRLRWFAVFGQLITVFAAGLLVGTALPWVPLLSLIAVTAITNVAFAIWLRQARREKAELTADRTDHGHQVDQAVSTKRDAQADSIATFLMVVDLITLTCMLYFSGGIDNPFSLFYLVNLAVGGVILRPQWAWVLAAMAIAGCTLLMFLSVPIEGLIEPQRNGQLSPHTVGLFIAYATCASVVTHFVTRTAAELTRSERLLRETQAANQRAQRLEGLTTLAAGAAHELASPLSTIDVIARELGRHLQDCETPESVRQDVRLIDQQLEICRQILRRMRGAVGDSMAGSWDRTTVGDLIDCALEGVRDPDRVDVEDAPDSVEGQSLWIPQEAVAQAIRNLIHNGLDASGPGGRVKLETSSEDSQVVFLIRDSGRGMTDEELGRAGEPFYTTKEPGRGMGLGLFLTRNVVSRLGGSLEFKSVQGQGTVATVKLPCAESVRRSAV
jgi:two-component system sensor histidine kinase RegB